MTEQNTEIESLRTKNAELLSELKTTKQQLREEKEARAADAGNLVAAKQELTTIKTAGLLAASWKAAGVDPVMSKFAIQEIGFELGIDDEGNVVAIDKESGQTIGDNETGEAADPKKTLIDAFEDLRGDFTLFFGHSEGGGAMGDDSSGYRQPATPPAKPKTPVVGGLR